MTAYDSTKSKATKHFMPGEEWGGVQFLIASSPANGYFGLAESGGTSVKCQ